MKKQLERPPYNIKAPILGLHDRPAEIFQPITATEERLNFLKSLPETADYASTIVNGDMGLLVSSTSWTPDEDFSILLSALQSYSEELTLGKLPVKPLLVMVTGKGPQKETYLKKIASLREKGELNNITILTPWLTAQNYANLLASADLGVCLHMSSSGVDLPMKVVDMFGSGLPVVGYGAYESWPELVTNEVNGMSFETADELADLLKRLLSRDGEAFLDRLKEGAMKEGSRRWDDEWDSVAGRVVGFCD